MTAPLAPGAYLRLRRQAAGLHLVDVAAVLASEPALAERDRADWLRQIEDGVMPASFNTIAALRSIFAFDLDVLARLAMIDLGMTAERPELCDICATHFPGGAFALVDGENFCRPCWNGDFAEPGETFPASATTRSARGLAA